jgi:hypothetical protein
MCASPAADAVGLCRGGGDMKKEEIGPCGVAPIGKWKEGRQPWYFFFHLANIPAASRP